MYNKITVGLISHYFNDTNLGCTALSICNVLLIDSAARKLGIEIEYKILCNEKQPHVDLLFTNNKYEYRVYPSTKKAIKHPLKTIGTKVFKDCDIVFNLCAGDGFTDIYGKWRVFSESYMTIIGKHKGCTMVLSPQTIGPFQSKLCRFVAHYMLNCCEKVFVRDHLSYQLCCKMGQKNKTREVIDVALALPYKKIEQKHDKINIGLNVSGLLYNDHCNKFGLSINYQDFVHNSVRMLLEQNFRVHLISHVIIPDGKGEDDYIACNAVHKLFPDTILAPVYTSPIDVKGYIAGMDLFIGARMHATIAAISSEVPVIPIAYSRKVNGLYGNLNYPFFIDAKNNNLTTDKALNLFNHYLSNIDKMKKNIEISRKIYSNYLDTYIHDLTEIMKKLLTKKTDRYKNEQ